MYKECLKNASIGTVVDIDEDYDIVVLYPSGNRWTFNSAVLTKVRTPIPIVTNSSSLEHEKSIAVGSIVKISCDIQLVRQLQQGHGEWTDAMELVILDYIYIRIFFCRLKYFF